MKVYCLGYHDKKADKHIDCALETTARSYQQVIDDPNWTEFGPAYRLINGELAIFSQCIACCSAEEDIE